MARWTRRVAKFFIQLTGAASSLGRTRFLFAGNGFNLGKFIWQDRKAMEFISKKKDQLRTLCSAHHVDNLYLFGSVLTPDFSDKSDIDFLVRFKAVPLPDYFENYLNFKDSLSSLFNRDIDLLEEQTLKNPILIRSINRTKVAVYG